MLWPINSSPYLQTTTQLTFWFSDAPLWKKLQILPQLHYYVVQEGWRSWGWRGIVEITQPPWTLQCGIGAITMKGYIEYFCGKTALQRAYSSQLTTSHIFLLPLLHRVWLHHCYLDIRDTEIFPRLIHWVAIFILKSSTLLVGFSWQHLVM